MNKLALCIVVLVTARIASATPEEPPHPLTVEEFQREYHENQAEDTHNEHIATGIEWVNWGVETAVSFHELWDAYEGLTSFDTTCIDFSAAGAPPIPLGCAENEATCGQCYRDAYNELATARIKLEKLRCVYQATKHFADKAISFGDSASGIHALVGLEWQKQKKLIEESVDQLNHTYDGKLGEFLPLLKTSLEHVGRCEQQFMNEPDWYTRFGFIYFTFMNDRYKRKD